MDAPAKTTEEFATHGPVHLDVTDGERSLLFWRDVLGLEVVGREGGTIELGAGGATLLILHPGADGPVRKGHTGLYHLAVHVPDAAEFAFVLARLFSARYPNSPTEHYFSKATYLDDLDGIGVEITLETPERVTGVTVEGGRPMLIDRAGNRVPGVDHLDLEEAMSHLGEGQTDRPLKSGTRIGHVHLHVNHMEAAEHFYRDLLGFPNGYPMPGTGMSDVHFGGDFKHRIAYNVWQGPGAVPPPQGTAGLRHFTLRRPAGEVEASVARLSDAGFAVEAREDGHLLRDPAGNALVLGPA